MDRLEREVMSVDGTAKVTATAGAPGTNDLNRDILNALADLVRRAGAIGESIGALFDLAPSGLLAMFKLDDGMPMKELAQHMSCDASFVTVIADALEQRGFARREPSVRDRRVKNLVLTPEGIAAKERLMKELALRMPWCYALDEHERQAFLAVLKKMQAAGAAPAAAESAGGGEPVTKTGAATS